ncbi:MAG: LrgB family protein [Thomasclavelia sp.]
MTDFINNSAYFGLVISLATYFIAVQIRKKLPYPIINPLLISALISIAFLVIFDIDFQTYNQGAQFITFLLTPATVCLAIPLYKQTQILLKHFDAIIISLFCGCLAGIISIVIICLLMQSNNEILYSLLPKSITTAIAIGVSDKLGGNSTITVGVVIITGILGAIIAKSIFKLFRIDHPVARGLALGNSAHAIGTSKALELGEIEGAMSSLSIAIAGLLTVILAPIIASFI